MRTLIIDCSGFSLEHAGFVIDENAEVLEKVQLPTSEIASYASQAQGLQKIRLAGPTEYCLGLKEEISKKLALEYAVKDIEIEVM